MKINSGKILKAKTVQMQGTYQLGLNAPSGTAQNPAIAQSTAPRVRIVEKNDTFAVVEVICGCGSKTYVQCNYDNQI